MEGERDVTTNYSVLKRKEVKFLTDVGAVGCSLLGSALSQATTQLPLETVVTGMGAYASGAYIHFAKSMPGLEGCSNTQYELWLDFTASDGKAMYATALAAFLSGRSLGFGVSGCNSVGTAVVYRVDVGS